MKQKLLQITVKQQQITKLKQRHEQLQAKIMYLQCVKQDQRGQIQFCNKQYQHAIEQKYLLLEIYDRFINDPMLLKLKLPCDLFGFHFFVDLDLKSIEQQQCKLVQMQIIFELNKQIQNKTFQLIDQKITSCINKVVQLRQKKYKQCIIINQIQENIKSFEQANDNKI